MADATRRDVGTADATEARRKYRHLARTYDLRLASARGFHRRAVARLDPKPGEVILDVGCGTGLAFPLIEEGIGTGGRLIGLELSEEMLAKARERVEQQGWENVTLIEAPAQEAKLPSDLDAVLFVLTHDIIRTPEALANVVRSLRPGGRVVAAGSKWAAPWLVPLNVYVWLKARRYVTTFEGFDRPWTQLAEQVPGLRVDSILGGAGYVASGTKPPR